MTDDPKLGSLDQQTIAACCTAMYGHPLSQVLMGPSWHPGGLALTEELVRQTGIQADHELLDAGAGKGTSAVHLAKTFGCAVTGITLEEQGVEAARLAAERASVAARTTFVATDLSTVELGPDVFDVALMECVLSTIVDKPMLLSKLYRSLKPGGSLVLSDVLRDGTLPSDIGKAETTALCLAGAMPLGAYSELLTQAGFEVTMARREDRRTAEFMRGVKAAFLVAEAASNLGWMGVSAQTVQSAREAFHRVERLVPSGVVSYASFIARRL